MADDLYSPKEVLNLANLHRKVAIASTAYFETRVMADFIKHAQTNAPDLQLETRSPHSGMVFVECVMDTLGTRVTRS